MPEASLKALRDHLLEALNTAVIVLDESLQLTYLNPAAENLFEVSRRQARGQYWPQAMQADAALVDRLRGCLESNEPFTERELEVYSSYGQRMTVDCTVTPLGNAELLLEVIQVDRHLRIAHEEHLLVHWGGNP